MEFENSVMASSSVVPLNLLKYIEGRSDGRYKK